MKASELLVRCLENEGVKHIFGIPGEENMDVMDALLDSDIQFVQTRHEQGAAFMADVHGRLTGTAGVCMSTLGPGATNLITGIADANMDSAPLVAITGQVSLDRMHKESHQYMDIVSTLHPITKWNTLVHTPDITAEVVRKAFKVAQAERPGATHIDLPEDVSKMQVTDEPLFIPQPVVMEPMEESIRMAAELVSRAKHPLILAGNGVVRGNASNALRKFAEKLNIPVTHSFMGKGVIPYTHRLSLLTVGMQARDYIACGFDRADVVIAVGYDIVEYHPRLWNQDCNKTIIHIAETPAEVDRWYTPKVEVGGRIATALDRIASLAERKEANEPYGLRLRAQIMEDLEEHKHDTGFPMKPQRILWDVRRALADDDILISDVGAHKIWAARMYPCNRPNTCVISNGFAAMGIALPGAIAAKLIYPERKVVALSGDGGFMMNCQEMETAVRMKTPVCSLIFNDATFGLIEWKQINHYGRVSNVRFNNPDFVKFAEAFGAKGYRVQAADELLPILREALKQDVPTIIDCPVDRNENLKLSEKLGKLACVI